jgi:hypothetical protein
MFLVMPSKMVAFALAMLTPVLAEPQAPSVVGNPVIYINVVDKNSGTFLETLAAENLRVRIGSTVVPVVNVPQRYRCSTYRHPSG